MKPKRQKQLEAKIRKLEFELKHTSEPRCLVSSDERHLEDEKLRVRAVRAEMQGLLDTYRGLLKQFLERDSRASAS